MSSASVCDSSAIFSSADGSVFSSAKVTSSTDGVSGSSSRLTGCCSSFCSWNTSRLPRAARSSFSRLNSCVSPGVSCSALCAVISGMILVASRSSVSSDSSGSVAVSSSAACSSVTSTGASGSASAASGTSVESPFSSPKSREILERLASKAAIASSAAISSADFSSGTS